jgi:hypothetical protein
MTGFEPAAPSSRTKCKNLFTSHYITIIAILNNISYPIPTNGETLRHG